jgi:23S rRNA (cytosine1962-C5)-methyltransferase
MHSQTLITTSSTGYSLLDSGLEEKLERFGDVLIRRPDPQALWNRRLPDEIWNSASATYIRQGERGHWKKSASVPEAWTIPFGGLSMEIRLTSFKHTGIFPEQLANWQWAESKIKKAARPISILNLFGYTGGASLSVAQNGAHVCHVDGSKKAIEWARINATASNLDDKPIRWIAEDALTFVKREIRRGKKYDAIIMDPPAFGHGPKNEIWKIEEHFLPIITDCFTLLSDTPLFFLLNGYSSGYSSIAFANNLAQLLAKYGGPLEHGELALKEEGADGRLLPAGIYARWSSLQ